jgi:hypothetical protein
VVRKPKKGSSANLEDDIRSKFGLVSPGKDRENNSKYFWVRPGNISLFWTYDKGQHGLKEMGSVTDIDCSILGIFKLKYSMVLVITQ